MNEMQQCPRSCKPVEDLLGAKKDKSFQVCCALMQQFSEAFAKQCGKIWQGRSMSYSFLLNFVLHYL